MLHATLEYLEMRRTGDARFTYEIIVVDDCSTDSTVEVVEREVDRLASTSTSSVLKLLRLTVNRGKGGAVRSGVLRAAGELILMVDADNATEIGDFDKLEAFWTKDSYPNGLIVCGSRAHLQNEAMAKRHPLRNVLMHGFHLIVSTLCVQQVQDTQCGFKLFDRKAAQLVFPPLHIERWGFDVEMLYLAFQRKIAVHVGPTTKKVLELLKVPLSPDRLPRSTLMLVLDLSVPGDVLPSLVYWVTLVRKLLTDSNAAPPSEAFIQAKYGEKHPDRRDVSPISIPLLIVGAKYETFRDEDSVKRKGLIQAVRYIAHAIGATLLFTTVKDKALATQVCVRMKHHGDSLWTAGSDTFEEIGLPKGARVADFEESNLDKRMKLWAKAIAELYPPVTPPEGESVRREWCRDRKARNEGVSNYREELRRYKDKKTEKKPSAKKEAKE
ncbi:hypothetical protein DYB32_003999 [Aphanomyces invadans]|uniref:dolichyl-phosphate beta-glucosyltransferase n=1 Tax=Aphanomyces invadans TaxID=157072 RepID=A0A418AYU2_9STRA|nr:hypothetical protein DYB32_003999 [Aphanomyces invadans]